MNSQRFPGGCSLAAGCTHPHSPLLPISVGQGQMHPSLQPDFLPSAVAKEILVEIIEKKSREKQQRRFFSTVVLAQAAITKYHGRVV